MTCITSPKHLYLHRIRKPFPYAWEETVRIEIPHHWIFSYHCHASDMPQSKTQPPNALTVGVVTHQRSFVPDTSGSISRMNL